MKIVGYVAKHRRQDYLWFFRYLQEETNGNAYKIHNNAETIMDRVRFLKGEKNSEESKKAAKACDQEEGWTAILNAVEGKAKKEMEQTKEEATIYSKKLRSESRRESWRKPACSFAGNVYC